MQRVSQISARRSGENVKRVGQISAEFDMSRRRSYQLLDQGRVIGAIAEAAGESVNERTQISEFAAREIKEDLPAVTAEIKQRVECDPWVTNFGPTRSKKWPAKV